jgi:hypothetical protein
MSLLDKASLIVTPNAYKTSKLYSVVPNTTLGDMDVVRATTATRVNASGLIESVGLNIPRIDYTNGSCPSLLVEPQRTNLALRSEEFSNATWEKGTPITLVSNTTETISPFGINNATKATANGTGLIHIRQTAYSATTSPTTSSIFVKKANNRYVGFRNGGAGTLHDVFDFNTETWTNNSGSTLSFDKLINGWYRLKSSRTNTLSNTYLSIIIPDNTSGNETATVSNLTLYIFGAQAELNVLYATSYIPTIASTVTRNADVISKTGISSLIGQTEGTIFIECYNQLISSIVLFLNKNSSNSIAIATTPTGIQSFFICNSIQFQLLVSGYTVKNEKLKVAISYNSLGYKLFINGILKGTNTNSIIFTAPLTSVNLNDDAVINLNQTIYNNGIQLYKTALTDTECINLTTL